MTPRSPHPSPGPAVDPRISAVLLRFTAALPARIAAVRDGLGALAVGSAIGPTHAGLLKEVHNLAGSAGIFGLSELGLAAQELEHLLRRLRDAPLTSADIRQIGAAGTALGEAPREIS